MRKAEQAALSAASAQSLAEAEAAAARERAEAAEAAAQEREMAAEAAARARAEAAEAARAEAEREAARLRRELKAAHAAQAMEGAGGPSFCLPLCSNQHCSLTRIERHVCAALAACLTARCSRYTGRTCKWRMWAHACARRGQGAGVGGCCSRAR